MDNEDDFTGLVRELRELRPSAMTDDFLRKIERSMTAPPTAVVVPFWNRLSEWCAWPVAACFVCTVAWLCGSAGPVELRGPGQRESVAATPFKPVEAENILYDVREEGLTTLADGTPARQIRDRYLDVFTWQNAAANSSVRWSVPRDEVRLVPIEAY